MATIWVVFEYDWESQVALEAWTTEDAAKTAASKIETERRAKLDFKPSSVWGIDVETLELKA